MMELLLKMWWVKDGLCSLLDLSDGEIPRGGLLFELLVLRPSVLRKKIRIS